jgi:hypothetical protein
LGEERCIDVWVGRLEGKKHLEYLVVDGRMISKCIFRKWDGGSDWIDLVQEGADGGCL